MPLKITRKHLWCFMVLQGPYLLITGKVFKNRAIVSFSYAERHGSGIGYQVSASVNPLCELSL